MTDDERKIWLQERIDCCHDATAHLEKMRKKFDNADRFIERIRKAAEIPAAQWPDVGEI